MKNLCLCDPKSECPFGKTGNDIRCTVEDLCQQFNPPLLPQDKKAEDLRVALNSINLFEKIAKNCDLAWKPFQESMIAKTSMGPIKIVKLDGNKESKGYRLIVYNKQLKFWNELERFCYIDEDGKQISSEEYCIDYLIKYADCLFDPPDLIPLSE